MIEKTGIDVVLHREAHGAVVRVPVVGEVGRLGAVARPLGGDADARPGPPEVHAEELRASLRELWEDAARARRRGRRRRRRCRPARSSPPPRSAPARARDRRVRRRAAPRGYARAGSLPRDASVRRRPSSNAISGSQPSSCRARVMSGCRTCGSSTGSASYTIWLDEPVEADHGLGQLEDRELTRVADVHRQVLARLGEQDQTADQVVDVTEAPCLRPVAVDRDRLLGERLTEEVRHRATVVLSHSRPVGS